jgi:hypothetical protein
MVQTVLREIYSRTPGKTWLKKPANASRLAEFRNYRRIPSAHPFLRLLWQMVGFPPA